MTDTGKPFKRILWSHDRRHFAASDKFVVVAEGFRVSMTGNTLSIGNSNGLFHWRRAPTRCRAGRQATILVRERLQTPFVIWTRWASAGGRTKTPRYYSFVEIEGHSLAALLVREGLARTKGVTATGPTGESHVVRETLQALERTAREHKRGIWATSTAGPTAQAAP